MIVSPGDDGMRVVLQDDHAHLAGELAAAIRAGCAAVGPDRSALVTAARVHDNGWREADALPDLDDEGRPRTFLSLPDGPYEAVWRRGIERAAALDPLTGLLVGLHGARFFGFRRSDGMRRLLLEERARESLVLAELGLGGSAAQLPDVVQAPSDLIAFLDAVSLQACGALGDVVILEVAGTPTTSTRDAAALVVDPWPFEGGSFEVVLPGRRLPRARFASGAELRAALAASRVERLVRRLRPAVG